MQSIDLNSWPRRAHFDVFRHFDYPHFNLTAMVDVDPMLSAARRHSASLTIIITYLLARTANQLVDFRLRIRGDEVIVHEIVHPSITILTPDELFGFCTIEYSPDFTEFALTAAEQIAHVREHPTLQDEPGQDNLLFMTSIPWVAFTSFAHPIHMHPADSVPRIAWGKIHRVEGRQKMPLSVQVHHALMDGLHVGRYFNQLQQACDAAETLLNE
ncbi:MAG: chloramphenicol acetyltransferase [Anaerolineales bacterium]|nr:MAG: chloramphenicol acetyltransferase [Anaerolineales bacterium]